MEPGRRSTRIPLPPVLTSAAQEPVNASVPAHLVGKPGPIIAVHRRNASPTCSDVSVFCWFFVAAASVRAAVSRLH